MAKLVQKFVAASVARPCGYNSLPDVPAIARLKARRQWVCWRYEDRGGPKPTKVPYAPGTGFKASTSNPSTWGSYEQAVARAERGGFDGIGFCLAGDDDLTGVDLDHCRDPDTGELSDLAQYVVDLAETYCEVTPSETGLRILVEGKIAAALKRDAVGVEMYGRGRYLTITGWHLPGSPGEIRPAEATLAALREAVAAHDAETAPAPANGATGPASFAPGPLPESDGGSPFFRAVNTAALGALDAWVPAVFGSAARFHPGTGAFRISSRALGRDLEEDLSIAPNGIRDWGVGDMGDPRQGARTPIDLVIAFGFERDPLAAARWLCQQMGKEPEAFGWEEGSVQGAAIAAALVNARQVVTNEHGEILDAATGEKLIPDEPAAYDIEMPAELAFPGGLVGEIADWICDSARRPNRALAIGAALTIVGTCAGRHVAGPTGSGTHLYVVGLAPTGAGKDHALQAIMTALASVDAPHLIGPSQFISMPAVINFLLRAPLSCCAMDEFGAFLKRIGSRKASGFEGAISGLLRTAWGSSFKPMPTPEWAGRQAELIMAPAMSIYGVSTAEEFYGSMEGADTSNGMLNRMLVIETAGRPKDRAPRLNASKLPAVIDAGLRSILHRAGGLVFAQLATSGAAPPVHSVPWGPGAEAAFVDMVEDIYRVCDRDSSAQAFYARSAETAVRLATILAVGRDPRDPVVTLADFTWAKGFVMWCSKNLHRAGSEHIADTDHQSATNAVRRAIREAGGVMTHRDLLRKLNHKIKNRDLHDIIKALGEADQVGVERKTPEKGGPATVTYTLLK